MENYMYDEYSDYDDLDYVHRDDEDFATDFLPSVSVESLLQCIVPSLMQIGRYISVYLFWNGIFAVTTQTSNLYRPLVIIIYSLTYVFWLY